jgi:hypothetical protein
VCLDDALREREAEADTAGATIAAPVAAEEGREDVREILRRNANAAIAHLERDRGSGVGRRECDVALGVRRVLVRVLEQVVERAAKKTRIGLDGG